MQNFKIAFGAWEAGQLNSGDQWPNFAFEVGNVNPHFRCHRIIDRAFARFDSINKEIHR